MLYVIWALISTGHHSSALALKLIALTYFIFSAGRNHYLTSLWLDIQTMEALSETHPDLLASFKKDGNHAARRSDRYWGGM